LVLAELVDRSRRWIGPASLLRLNRAGGAAIAGFGVLALTRAFVEPRLSVPKEPGRIARHDMPG
jgi:hypothetical protein